MQEALDHELTPDALRELRQQMDEDAGVAAQYNRLRQVDTLLSTAPFERAPQRLAASIMARLAESIKPQQLSRVSGLALALGLALVLLVAFPLLVAASWLFLSAAGSAAALDALIQQVVGVLAVIVGMLEVLVSGAQQVVADYPQAPALLLALIPLALFFLARNTLSKQSNEPDAGGT